jgi:hypothetical protein
VQGVFRFLEIRQEKMSGLASLERIGSILPWFPAYLWQRCLRRTLDVRPVHLIIALADHFEPSIEPGASGAYADRGEQVRRLEKWCREYPGAVDAWRDDEGRPFRHTYFYPAEQYDGALIDRLAEHCHDGWGEIEIHLHHGVKTPDTRENTRRVLSEFRDDLEARGCLSREDGVGPPRYAFVHGNWALANSAQGRFCGVDGEMQILAETGCYADFTLPAPSSAQVRKINAIYECSLPLNQRAPHRRGRDLQSGRAPKIFPLIIQGPLQINFGRRKRGRPFPGIEDSALTSANPPTMERLRLWRQAAITVHGRPEWLFVKLHCHGMDPRDEQAMLGAPMQNFLRDLTAPGLEKRGYHVHFATAREMVNIALAACDGNSGNPGQYRDYRFRLNRASGENESLLLASASGRRESHSKLRCVTPDQRPVRAGADRQPQ